MTKSSASCCSGLEPEPLVVLVVATAVVTGGVPAVAIVRIFPGADPTGDDDPGNPVMATGDGGSAPGMAVPAPLLGGGPRCSWPPLHGAEFLGVVELETGADVGTLTGLVGVGGGGGATGTAGLINGWLKKVSKSILSLASLLSRPKRRLANSGEVPFGILGERFAFFS